jgi:hypothetical protein
MFRYALFLSGFDDFYHFLRGIYFKWHLQTAELVYDYS